MILSGIEKDFIGGRHTSKAWVNRQIRDLEGAARRAAQPAKRRLALGFLTGQEMTWLPQAMHILRDELPTLDVSVCRVVGREPLVVSMPSDVTSCEVLHLSYYPTFRRIDRNRIPSFIAFYATAPGDRRSFFAA